MQLNAPEIFISSSVFLDPLTTITYANRIITLIQAVLIKIKHYMNRMLRRVLLLLYAFWYLTYDNTIFIVM